MLIKFLLLGRGGLGFLKGGGGSANSIFMGVGIFPIPADRKLLHLNSETIFNVTTM